jgi:hypothetical protein|tara:strand:+ start:573 stop:824 length:252 start_codon:yes stop_codon:yes gene_type:complete
MRFAETAKYGTTRRKIQMRAENHIFSQSNNTPSKYSLKSPNNAMILSAGPTYRGNTPNKTQRIRTIDHTNNMMYNTQVNFGGP